MQNNLIAIEVSFFKFNEVKDEIQSIKNEIEYEEREEFESIFFKVVSNAKKT